MCVKSLAEVSLGHRTASFHWKSQGHLHADTYYLSDCGSYFTSLDLFLVYLTFKIVVNIGENDYKVHMSEASKTEGIQ